jgi:prepilin-type N-terminal cleavage/methylation domain-containing protein
MKISVSLQKRKSGFTLIELLVVIAIIAILASILFPVFGRARDNARRSSGISNVKQISLGVLQYLQDYDERFLPSVTERQSTDSGRYGSLPATIDTARIFSYRSLLQPYLKSSQIFKDPSAPEWPAEGPGQYFSTDYGYHNNEANYSAGFGQSQWYRNNPSFGVNESHTLASINNASKYIVIGEAGRSDGSPSRGGLYPLNDNSDPSKYYGFPGGANIGTLSSQARPYKRHFDGVIFGYLDGHAKWVKPETTWRTPVVAPALNTDNQWSRDVQ